MINIKLDSGIEVKVNAFEFEYTYAGMLEGTPNKRTNENIFRGTTCPLSWGDRKTLIISPTEKEFNERFKPVKYSVWLISYTSVKPEYDGAELVVVWFGDRPDDRSVEKIIKEGVRHISWNFNAQDFYF